MKNSIVFCFLLLGINSLIAQEWKSEIAKHQDKPVVEIIKEMDKYFDKIGATRANKYHHFIRWQIDAINHVNNDGMLANKTLENQSLLKNLEKQEKQYQSGSRHFHGIWESANPNNFQNLDNSVPAMGRVNALAISPTNQNVLYAGAATGGVWKSTNHGASWTPLWDGMIQMGVSDIIVDSQNSNHILVLSGSADGYEIPSSGILESFDGGDTWTNRFPFDLEDKLFCHKMVQNPNSPNIIYVAKNYAQSGGGQLIKLNTSTGSVTNVTQSSYRIYDMEYSLGSTNTLYLATSWGLFKMIQSESVSQVSIPDLPDISPRGALSVAPSDQNYIYYLHTGSDSTYSLFRSTNGGSTFPEVVNENTSGDTTLLGQIKINLNLAVSPTNRETVYIGSVKYSKSTNGGNSWIEDKTGMHADAHDIVMANGRHYVCTDGGISYRNLGDANWLSINNGLLVTQFYKMDKQGNKLVGGTQDNGTMFWNEGDTIGLRKLGADGFDCQYHPSTEDRLQLSTQEWLYYSTDNGETYTRTIPHRWASPVVHWEGVASRVITFDKNNLRFSYNHGTSWVDSIDIFTNNDVYLYSGFSQCADNPNIAYSTGDKQVVKTTNLNQLENSTWNDISPTLNSGLIFRNILVHPDNCNEVYLTLAGYNQTQIFKSVDGGNEWTPYNEGLQNMPIYCIYYDHVNENALYIGTELGVFYRTSDMDEWIPYSTYLPRVQIMDLNITDTHVYAATYGRGIWKSERYKSCEYNITLTQANDPTSNTHSGVQIFKASNAITSNRIIRGRLGTDVKYQSGNYVDLTEGFHAKQYNKFVAKAAGCEE